MQAELMMLLVMCGCRFTYEYGDMFESFYTGMANNFERALKFMQQNDLPEQFKDDAEQCVRLSGYCGYGFTDDMAGIFEEYYGK